MPEIEPEPSNKKLDKVKEVVKNNWKPFTIGATLTIVTFVVTKRVTTQYIRLSGTSTFIHKDILNDTGLYKVFNIYTPGRKHFGPSWMIRCRETGKSFPSLVRAAEVMDLDPSSISRHLNEHPMFENVHGYHFERIGVAV